MKQYKTILLFMLLAASAIVTASLYFHQQNELRGQELINLREKISQKFLEKTPITGRMTIGPNPRNNSYYINKEEIILTDGVLNVNIGDKTIMTKIISETIGDINNDELEDTVLILERDIDEEGGKLFHYIALAIQNSTTYFTGTNGILLEDYSEGGEVKIKFNRIFVRYMTNDGSTKEKYIELDGRFLEEKSKPKIQEHGEEVNTEEESIENTVEDVGINETGGEMIDETTNEESMEETSMEETGEETK